MSSNNMTPSTIAEQEAAMWAEYRAEQEAIAQTPVGEAHEEESVATSPDLSDVEEDRYEMATVFPQARCELSPRDIRQFPGQRTGTTTKDRRYMAQRVKATDQSKTLGKRPGPSGKPYQQIKSEDFPHSDV